MGAEIILNPEDPQFLYIFQAFTDIFFQTLDTNKVGYQLSTNSS